MTFLPPTSFGGDNTNIRRTTVSMFGGYNNDLSIIEKKVVICDSVEYFIDSKVSEWNAFKKLYLDASNKTDNKKDNDNLVKHKDAILNFGNSITPVSSKMDNIPDAIKLLKTIRLSNVQSVISGIANYLNLRDVQFKLIRYFFMVWKMYIEVNMELFVHYRNLTNPTNPDDFKTLIQHWTAVDIENKIDTSSIILFFNFPRKKFTIDKTIPKIRWNIKDSDINKLVNDFLKTTSDNGFEYLGFCPHSAILRLVELLKFPLSKLININDKLRVSLPNKHTVRLAHGLVNINKQIQTLKKTFEQISPVTNVKQTKIATIANKRESNLIVELISEIGLFIDFYKLIKPSVIKREKHICDRAEQINILADVVNTEIKKIRKLL
jgi:hypothetical protein